MKRYTDNFFIFEGKGYTTGTKVKLKKEYTDTHTHNGQKIWPYAEMDHKNSNGTYFMYWCNLDYSDKTLYDHAPFYLIDEKDMEWAVEEIIKPYEIELVKRTKLKDWECPEVMMMWPVYIIAMVLGLVFVQVGSWWAFCSLLFFGWRWYKLWE